MEVKLIVLKSGSELPENCRKCLLSRLAPRKGGLFDLRCSVTQKYTKTKKIPSWCPLVIEEECVWKGGKRQIGKPYEYFLYKSPHEPPHFHGVIGNYDERKIFNYCHVCGKRVKYVEEE